MKKVLLALLCVAAMMAAGTGLRAQEVTISLNPGWNWISYPYAVSMTIDEALANFQAMVGDQLKSKTQVAAWDDDEQQWSGSLTNLTPGQGYMYYSSRTEVTSFVFANPYSSFVTTAEPTDITATSAVVSSTVTIGEGNHVYARGVCWGTEPNPDIDGSHTSNGIGIGSFSDTLTELTSSTTYYVRAYMVTDYGLTYGEELSFTTESGIPAGTINGLFSVSENTQVYFSQGNLQYQASTNTWRFAENQWDCLRLENANVSSTYDGWIDLFGWGTSGYDHGAVCYQPWSTSTSGSDYYAYGSSSYNLYDQTGQADWGYNAISNGGNTQNQWRTLTSDEWSYMLFNRDTPSGIRFAKAIVNGIEGLVVLPDNWDSSIYSLSETDSTSVNYSVNVINENDWMNNMEANGAVFLPAGSCRYGSSTIEQYNPFKAYYWTSSNVNYVEFNNTQLFVGNRNRTNGLSVRLVRTVQDNCTYTINTTCSPTGGGTAIGAGTYNAGETCTLTATANAGYTFINWTENSEVVSIEATYSFTVGNDRNMVANFTYNGGGTHDYIDLGLPSGLLWATCNVGADTPEGYGDYFAWGETQPKDTYDWSTYQYCMGSNNTLTKYCNNSSYGYNGFTDSLTILLPEDDAAITDWGADWRMPTKEEWQELYSNTTVTWTQQNGVSGRLFTATNGNNLFLPAVGGCYWSSSLSPVSQYAWGFNFSSDFYGMANYSRSYGFTVRPVCSVPSSFLSVTTIEVTDITQTTAVCGGVITNDGGTTVIERGICWSTSPNPTMNDNHVSSGSGIGSYTVDMTGLMANTTYYVRAYATNSVGTAYGNEVSFITLQDETSLPVVTTSSVYNITRNSAIGGGTVVSDGGYTVTERGICWSTSSNPTINSHHANNGTGLGNYTVNMSSLSANTTYYVKAYAINSAGVAYGDAVQIKTPPSATVNGCFSINGNGGKICFSKGNLQCRPSSETWKFADHQYDCIGTGNIYIQQSYTGYIDLFGWGTSGYPHGATCYEPWSTSMNDENYYAYGNSTYNLYDRTGYADWGNSGHSISGSNKWRTLKTEEWIYIINQRYTQSGLRYAKAQVNGVNGLILLPDDWSTSYYSLNYPDQYSVAYNTNVITSSQWSTLENHGAVFLPAAGFRGSSSVFQLNSTGAYWSSSCVGVMGFDGSSVGCNTNDRHTGRSVRLVFDTH